MLEPLAKKEEAESDVIPDVVLTVVRQDLRYLFGKSLRYSLVGVKHQDPLVRKGHVIECPVALRSVPLKRMVEHGCP